VHVYGNPCDIEEITKIAAKHKLKVIYDACHTFGVTLNGNSILNFGDLSVLSFHATKVFNTFEGGAIISHDKETKTKIDRLKNFGFVNETTIDGVGINGKMNEFQAALGLLQLKYVDKYIQERKRIVFQYRKELADINGVTFLEDFPGVKHCYSYFPVIIDKDVYGKNRDDLYMVFKKNNIWTRRYFYPAINQITQYKNIPSAKAENLPVTNTVSQQIICLPVYPGLEINEVSKICEIIRNLKKHQL
jgi:dTDP-4-amino-4,6-dideoxygalactose transaminase